MGTDGLPVVFTAKGDSAIDIISRAKPEATCIQTPHKLKISRAFQLPKRGRRLQDAIHSDEVVSGQLCGEKLGCCLGMRFPIRSNE